MPDIDPNLSDDDLRGAAQAFMRGGQLPAVSAVNDNPDKAAQAVGLSDVTGAPAQMIHDDLDGFQTALKQRTTANIVQNNPHIAAFTQNPMAARVSNDDLHNLDAVSTTLQKSAQPSAWSKLADFLKPTADDQALMNAFYHGYDNAGQMQEIHDLANYVDSPVWRNIVYATAPINPAVLLNSGMHMFQGAQEMGATLLTQMYRDARSMIGKPITEVDQAQLGRDLNMAGQVAFAPEAHLAPELHTAVKEAARSNALDAQRARQIAKPFLDEGKPPPVGIDPQIDAIHKAQSDQDLAGLKKALAQSQESTMRKRAPSMYVEFVRQRVGDATVGVNADAVREMYKGEVPHFEDGKLGWVDDLPAQMLRSTVTGEDIQIPVKDLLTRMDPAVYSELEPYIRTRPGGVTDFEAQALADRKDTVTGYHATNQAFDEFDPNAPTTKGGRSPVEDGVSFFGDSPREVARYGTRVLQAEIDPGKTGTFDLTHLYNNDPTFLEKAVEVARKDNAARGLSDEAEADVRDTHARYMANEASRRQLIEAEGGTYLGPEKVSNRSGARQAAIQLAREQGLDTVRIENLREGNQLAVLNPEMIRKLSDGDIAVRVLREQAGLVEKPQIEQEGAYRHYEVTDPSKVEWRRGDGTNDEILMRRNTLDGGKKVDTYANVGEAEGTASVIQQLHKIVGPLPPLEDAAARVAPAVLDRLGISDVPTYTVDGSHPAVRNALGMYYPQSDAIVLRQTASDRQMLRTSVHEAYHAAFMRGIEIVPGVKEAIEHIRQIALDTGATAKDHYGLTNAHEFASEAFSKNQFQEFLSSVKLTPEQAARFNELIGEKTSSLKNLWDAFLQLARKTFGLGPGDMTALDAAFRVGDRLTAAGEAERPAVPEGVDFQQHPLPALPDPAFDHAAALGMNKRQLELHRRLIEKQIAEESDARNREILAEERKRQGAEWKKNEVEERKSASADLARRPDIVADSLLRNGTKLDTDALSDDQRSALDGAHTRGGVDPDALAHQLGYETGDKMMEEVAQLRKDRGSVQPQVYARQLVAEETARRMEAKYGNQDRNVIEAAKDRVLSETQEKILFNDADAAAQGQNPVTPAMMKQNVANAVGEKKLGQIDSSATLAAAGRAAKAMEDAHLRGDAKEYFAQRMRQLNHFLTAKEEVKVEKLRAEFDKTAVRYSKTQIPGAEQEYVDRIHQMLSRLGRGIQRSEENLNTALGGRSFADWVDDVQSGRGRVLNMPDFLLDEKFNTKLEDLTTSDFKDVAKALKAMVKNSRDEQRITRAGEKADFIATRDEMLERLRKVLPIKNKVYNATPSQGLGRILSAAGWSHIGLEAYFDRFDRLDPKGVFNQTFTREFTQGAAFETSELKHYENRLRKEFSGIKNPNKQVENNLFVHPTQKTPLRMTRLNVLGVLQQVGNRTSFEALTRGWKISPDAVMEWLGKNTTKEDWDRAQRLGDIFKEIAGKSDDMYMRLSGSPMERVEINPVQTPFGEYEGWYQPIARDAVYGRDVSEGTQDSLLTKQYYREMPGNSYRKLRTGYIAPTELDLGVVPLRMRQMIHDYATREVTVQMAKFFHDDKFMQGVKDHYGLAQAAEMKRWLKDFAGSQDGPSENMKYVSSGLAFLNQNFVASQVGLNLNTVIKHGTGALAKSIYERPLGFTVESAKIVKELMVGRTDSIKLAFEKSNEIPLRTKTFEDMLGSQGQTISLNRPGPVNKFMTARAALMNIGSKPIAWFDLMSSVPTFNAVYRDALAKGLDEGQAIYEADKAVRKTHGTGVQASRPGIARQKDPLAKSFANFYQVFSENFQKQYESAWLVRDALRMANEGDLSMARSMAVKAAGIAFMAGPFMALLDYEVEKSPEDKNESWPHFLMHIALNSTFSGVLLARDIARAAYGKHDPQGSSLPQILKSIVDPIKDLTPDKHGKVAVANPQKVGKFLKDSAMGIGTMTGLTNAFEGNVAKYSADYFNGLVHPRNPWQAYIGLRFGTNKNHTRNYEEWLHQDLHLGDGR